MHQRKRLHHHQQDVFGERPVVLHPVFEQRAQKIGVIGRERQVGLGQSVELADRVFGRNRDQAGGQGPNRLAIYGQDQAVEVSELVIDASDRAIGGLRDIPNFQ